MSNWIAITLGNLEDASVAGVVDAMRNDAIAQGNTDPWPRLVQQVTNEIRALIAFSGRYQLDADTTKIPNGLFQLAVKKVVREISRSLNRPLSADDKSDEVLYEKRLEQIRDGQWAIDLPDTPLLTQAAQSAAPTPLISKKKRHFSHRDEAGF